MAILLQTLLLILPFFGLGMSLKLVKGLHVNADNIKDLATFLHEKASIKDRLIHFASGYLAIHTNEKLMEVPIGCIERGDSISITVGLLKDHYNTRDDRDPRIGISDGTHYSLVTIHDVNNYNNHPPCIVRAAEGEDDNRLVSSGTQVSATFKLTFNPEYQYTACETAQDDGYVNTGHFHTPLELSQQLYLRLNRDDYYEAYYFEYFLVEITKVNKD